MNSIKIDDQDKWWENNKKNNVEKENEKTKRLSKERIQEIREIKDRNIQQWLLE